MLTNYKTENLLLMDMKKEEFMAIPQKQRKVFINEIMDNVITYLTELNKSYLNIKDTLPKAKSKGVELASVNTNSLKAWLKNNDTRNLIDDFHRYGNVIGTKDAHLSNEPKEFESKLIEVYSVLAFEKARVVELELFTSTDEKATLIEAINFDFGNTEPINQLMADVLYNNDTEDVTLEELQELWSTLNKEDKENHKVTLDLSVIDSFKFCPLCGSEVYEVYVGDFTGSLMCNNTDCEGLDFDYTFDK